MTAYAPGGANNRVEILQSWVEILEAPPNGPGRAKSATGMSPALRYVTSALAWLVTYIVTVR